MRPRITRVNPGHPSAPSDKEVHTENVTPTLSRVFSRRVLLSCLKTPALV